MIFRPSLLLLGFCFFCFAENLRTIRFEHLVLPGHIPQYAVSCLFQDSKGFLWVAAEDGLQKHDGYSFRMYRHEPFDPFSLSSNEVSQIIEDRSGQLWLIADGVLNRFDRKTDRFYAYESGVADTFPLKAEPTLIFCDSKGVVWVGTRLKGLYRYEPETDSFLNFHHDPSQANSLSDDWVTGLYEARSGRLWVTTWGGGLNAFNEAHQTFTHFLTGRRSDFDFGINYIPFNGDTPSILEDKNGVLWIVTNLGGLIRFDPKHGTYTQYLHKEKDPNSLSHNLVNAHFMDSFGLLWLATEDGGLDCFDPETERFRRFRHEPGRIWSLADRDFRRAFFEEDSNGNLWIGSLNGGVSIYERESDRFYHYEHNPENSNGLLANDVRAMLMSPSETLWVGTESGGLHKYSKHRKKFEKITTVYTNKFDLDEVYIDVIYEDSSGNLWLGTREQGLALFDRESGNVLEHYQKSSNSKFGLFSNTIQAVLEDEDGSLWIGTAQGLSRFSPQTERFRHFKRDSDRKFDLTSNRIYCLYRDRANRLWIGTGHGGLHYLDPSRRSLKRFNFETGPITGSNSQAIRVVLEGSRNQFWVGHEGTGLHQLNLQTGASLTYVHDVEDRETLSNNNVSSLLVTADPNRLWVGTLGGGLNVLDLATERFRHFSVKTSNLPDNLVQGLLADGEGQIWLSLPHGLTVFDPENETFQNYTTGDGLQNHSVSANAFFENGKGQFFRGGFGGFNLFHPLKLPYNPYIPDLAITSFKKLGRERPGEIESGDRLTLDYRDHFFTFEFAALDYTYPEKNRYAYKLEGFDSDWIYSDNHRAASYTNLDDGLYTFQVKGSNNDGVWNDTGFKVHLRIMPPFWRTWWFYSLEVLGLICGLFFAFRYQTQRLQHQKDQELKALDLKRKTVELEHARKIQLSMLPNGQLSDDHFKIYGRMITATEVGGDYYDFFKLSKSDYCAIIGDATGHGFAAGMVVGMTKLATNIWALNHQTDLEEMLVKLNAALKRSLKERSMGMGLGIAIMNSKTGHAQFAFSGMPYPYHYHRASRTLAMLEMKGPPLGFLRNIRVSRLERTLARGDLLIFLSDGIPERFNTENEIWGTEALERDLLTICQEETSPENVVDRIFLGCDRFAKGRSHEDDMTLLVVKVR